MPVDSSSSSSSSGSTPSAARPKQKNVTGRLYMSYLVLRPVVEQQVDADEEKQGNDNGLFVLESERLGRRMKQQ